MRGVLGLLIFALILLFVHDAAKGGVEVRCQPVTVPDYTHCYTTMGESFTKRPLRCRVG